MPLVPDPLAGLASAAAHAIGRLDGAVTRSPVRALWHERAAVVGIADCLGLAGLPLTPAEFFRSTVGLTDARFVQSIDRGLAGAVITTGLPLLLPDASGLRLFEPFARASGLHVAAPWADEHRPAAGLIAALSAALVPPRADVGTALYALAAGVGEALVLTRAPRDPGAAWPGWVAAALLPAAIAGSGLTAAPLPCLTGLTRGLRYTTTDPAEVYRMVFITLAAQAVEGLARLRRLEACAGAWRERLAGVTRRSRAGAGAGLFLVWPALTAGQFATALGVTPAGAAKLLKGLAARDIVVSNRIGARTFYVATESLGDFKLAPSQGRASEAPALPALLAEVDAALAAFDLLGLELPAETDAEDRVI